MKKKMIAFLVLCPFVIGLAIAQAPNAFKYQSMFRKANGMVLSNQAVSLRISILNESDSGTAVYIETQKTETNAYGIITINIGEGISQKEFYSSIDWSLGAYFVKIEIDEKGGDNYTLSGVSQLLSVPYALYAAKA